VVLVDPNVPPQENDKQLFEFLRSTGHRTIAAATKTDRLSGNQLRSALQALARELSLEDIVAYSARTGAGREELWRHIRQAANSYHAL
jgi:GTP-binding protein